MGSEIDPAAVEATTRKRPLESSDLAEVTPKRPCVDTDTDGDRFEEFFALLRRIEATQRYWSRSRGANRQDPAAKCVEAGKVEGAKTVTSQASWWPSFEWEDFLPGGNGARGGESKAVDRKLKGMEPERERVSPETGLDEDRSLDLNLSLGLISL